MRFRCEGPRIPTLMGVLVLGGAIACAAPSTRVGKLSPADVKAEQLKQQQLVIQSGIAEQQRLLDIAQPMLKAAVPLCGEWVTTKTGFVVSNIHSYTKEYHDAARSLGFDDSLTVTMVATGSAADRAGIRKGDRLIGIAGESAPAGRTAIAEMLARIAPKEDKRGQPVLASEALSLKIRRSSADTFAIPVNQEIQILPDTVCAYGTYALKDQVLNAWADGKRVVVTTSMMRFAGSDDELAVVVAHEIAHNAKRHIDAKKKNATVGAIFGAVLDIAAATQGINTGGDFTNSGAAIGSMRYSQDFEREADYVGMYILARAGRPFVAAPNFWRRMGQESPGSIKYASSHPTSAERFLRLEQTVAEIQAKQAAGSELMPELKSRADSSATKGSPTPE